MVKSINKYILQAYNRENVSVGGSPAYDFGDVILVEYSINSKYGLARVNEELVAKEANKKNEKGVNTPRHLAIKRIKKWDKNYCYVLQEKAKGESFTKYNAQFNDPQVQLNLQQQLLDAPDYHYEKCVSDLIELFHMGLELKSKNIFYDDSKENGGFYFIDLLGYDPTPMNPNSISDILQLDSNMGFICNTNRIYWYDSRATEEEKQKSLELSYKIRKRSFEALEKMIPNFTQFRRWVLRSYSKDVLDYFENDGIFIGDLSLTEEEYEKFNIYIELIVDECLKNIAIGKNLFWEIGANVIRIMLDNMGMRGAWNMHKLNPIKNPEDFEHIWDFENAKEKSLDDLVNNIFNQKLIVLAENSTNPYILQAKNDLDKKIKTSSKYNHI